ncbi:hypothetical protein Bca101_042537 [Brassica carinata]
MMNCWSKGYSKIIFQGDSQNVVKLTNKEYNDIGVQNWLKDIWRWGKKFQGIQFKWTNRGSNECADMLAKQAIPNQQDFNYYDFIPNVIQNAFTADYFDH